VVNKIDAVEYDEARFREVEKEVASFIKKIGYKPEQVPFIPVSGWTGDNLLEREKTDARLLAWYKGATLLETLDTLTVPSRPTDKPLRIPVQDCYRIDGIGTVPVGRVESGVLKVNQNVLIAPQNITTKVKSIEQRHVQLTQATPGENVGFNLHGVSVKQVTRGCVVGDAKSDPPREVSAFVAQIIVLTIPTAIRAGYSPVVDCHCSHVACRFDQLIAKLDRRSGKTIEENPTELRSGDSALVRLVPLKPLVVEEFAKYPPLGRFVARDSGETKVVGVVKQCEYPAALKSTTTTKS